MTEPRSEKITVMLTPRDKTRLARYARNHRWSVSTAAATLIEDGLAEAEGEEGEP